MTAAMCINKPRVKEHKENLTSTHPPIQKRIAILRAMSMGTDYNTYTKVYASIMGKDDLPKVKINSGFQLPEEIVFPKPELADPDGLLAIGGDLSPQRLLTAYSIGIFPWSSEGEPILWWSLPQRLILFPDNAKFSKSLLQRIKKQEFEIRVDTNFQKVIENCASVNRKNQKEERG